ALGRHRRRRQRHHQQAHHQHQCADRRRRHRGARRPHPGRRHSRRTARALPRPHPGDRRVVQDAQPQEREAQSHGVHPPQDPARRPGGRLRDRQQVQLHPGRAVEVAPAKVRGAAADSVPAGTRAGAATATLAAARDAQRPGGTGRRAAGGAASGGHAAGDRAGYATALTKAAMNDAIAAAIPAAPKRVGFAFAKRHGVLVHRIHEGVAECVYRPGASPLAVAEVRRYLGVPLKLDKVQEAAFDAMLRLAYEAGNDAMEAATGVEESTDLAHLAQELPEQADLLESEDDAPIIRLINAVLTQAVKENASDIHVEPFENRLVVRFRVDGVLREVLQSKRAVAPLVVSRIKVMSKLDIAEKRLPQDGRISLRVAGRAVDVRVSTIPSGHGERVVLRLLDKQAGRLELNSLGMETQTEKLIDELIFKPHGILLVTGPTGSGKTTSLYAALERLNDNTRNIMTVEDPIEYYIDGIGQTQVNTKVEMTFARGLRAILRQDPDVVMVGEIRDLETAQIAVQA